MIDNYAEIAQNNEDSNDIIPQIKNAITNYARTFHFVIRSFKSDSFFVVSRNEDLENLKKDNFSILNTVRAIGKKEDVNTTLSIAFAHDFSTIAQNNEMASTALSIAMSRGGDQAVIAQMNHELIFFGGKSGAEESRNKVKVKSDANALLNHIETYKDNKIFIMGHRGMDMDALGSCLGIYEICKYKNCKDFHIVFDHTYTEKKTRYAFMTSFAKSQFDDMTISLKKAIDDGCRVLAYCTWSYTDLLSWLNGYQKRYGFVYVDREEDENSGTLNRYKKDSYYWYQKVIETNGEEL